VRPYRNPKILRYARDYPCIRCNNDDGTIVGAHYSGIFSDLLGKGMGQKPHDHCVAYLCRDCHIDYDSYTHGNTYDRAIQFLMDILLTQERLFRDGKLKVE